VGFEFLITPSFSLRAGAVHKWTRSLIDTKVTPTGSREVSKTVNGLGVETITYTSPTMLPTQLITKKDNNRTLLLSQNNTLTLGMGYSILKNVQLDLQSGTMVSPSTTITISSIAANATLLF